MIGISPHAGLLLQELCVAAGRAEWNHFGSSALPDSSCLMPGGGHVNPFVKTEWLVRRIEKCNVDTENEIIINNNGLNFNRAMESPERNNNFCTRIMRQHEVHFALNWWSR